MMIISLIKNIFQSFTAILSIIKNPLIKNKKAAIWSYLVYILIAVIVIFLIIILVTRSKNTADLGNQKVSDYLS